VKLAGNMAAAVVGKILTAFLGIATMAVLARNLGTEGLGEYRVVLTVLAFTAMAADFGIYMVTLRRMAEEPDRASWIFGNALACRIVCTATAIGVATLLVWALDLATYIRFGLLVAGIGWLSYQVSQFMVCVFQHNLCQHYAATADVVAAGVALLALVMFAMLGGGTLLMLGGTSLGFFAGLVVSLLLARRLLPLKLGADFRLWRELMWAGLPVAGSMMLLLIHYRGDIAVLALIRPVEEVGIYDIAQKFYELTTSLAFVFGGILMPLLTRDLANNDRYFPRRLAGALSVALAAAVAVMVLLFAFAEPLVVLIAGAEFRATSEPLRILAITSVVATLAFVTRFAAMSRGYQRNLLIADIAAILVSTLVYVWLIPRFSYMGAAIGKCVGDVLMLVGATLVVAKPSSIRLLLRPALEIAVAATVMIAMVLAASWSGLNWLFVAVLASSAYALALLPMKGLRAAALALASGRGQGAGPGTG
jgi:O-antigen/teichoic acid export membrane protein